MWPDRVSNPGPLTYESGTLPTALRGLAEQEVTLNLFPLYNGWKTTGVYSHTLNFIILTLKAPIATVADDINKYFCIIFQRK